MTAASSVPPTLAETFAGANGGYQTTQFYNGAYVDPSDPDLAMGGLQDNASTIYRGGPEWTRWVLGGDGGWCGIDASNPNRVYATAQFLFIGRSLDGGVSFANVSPNFGNQVAFMAPLVVSPQDALVLYGGTDFLLKSFNGGNQWFRRPGRHADRRQPDPRHGRRPGQ